MNARYESRRVAILDLLAAARYRLARHSLASPHCCQECGRIATSVPISRVVSSQGIPCGRRGLRLRPCQGLLVRRSF